MLEALEHPEADAKIRALIRFAERADDEGSYEAPEEAAQILLGAHFERTGSNLRLKPALLGDLAALRDRAARFEAALRTAPPHGSIPDERARKVRQAEALFNAHLFFEVHEILEPLWLAAEGDERELLQGLIQVAVGFHHAENDNRRGALSLLSEGNAKLFRHLPEAFDLDLETLVKDVEAFATALRHGETRIPPKLRHIDGRRTV